MVSMLLLGLVTRPSLLGTSKYHSLSDKLIAHVLFMLQLMYSGTSLKRTPLGHHCVSGIWTYP